MKRLLLMLVVLQYITITFGQEVKKEYFLNKKGKKTEDIWKEYQVVNGVKNGYYKSFYLNGSIEFEGSYVVGLKSGTWTHYKNNGNYYEIGKYEKDKKVGDWFVYENGEKIEQWNYSKTGIYIELLNRTKNDNDFAPSNLYDKDTSYFYGDSGNVIAKTIRQLGEFKSKFMYYNTGELYHESHKIDTCYLVITYYPSGNIAKREYSCRGKIDTLFFFDTNGNLLNSGNYENGNGKLLYYHGDVLVEARTFKDYIFDGERIIYYPNGKIAKRAVYRDGSLDTAWILYDTTGVVLDTHCDSDFGTTNTTILDPSLNAMAICMKTSGYNEDNLLGANSYYTKAEFPGGTSALYNYISENIKYPFVCVKNNIQGKVIIQFYISPSGQVFNPSCRVIVKKGLKTVV